MGSSAISVCAAGDAPRHVRSQIWHCSLLRGPLRAPRGAQLGRALELSVFHPQLPGPTTGFGGRHNKSLFVGAG